MIINKNGQLLSIQEVYAIQYLKQVYISVAGQDDYEFNKILISQGKAKTFADASHITRQMKELFKSL